MTNYMQNAARGSSSGARLNPLKMVILGATGATGLEVVRMAVERGHSMTAFVRSPDRLASFMDRIEVKRGDLLDASQLAQVIDNHDAIISSFGPRLPISKADAHLLEQFATALKSAMEQTGTKRVVVESVAFLFKDSIMPPTYLLGRLLFPAVVADSVAMERIFAESSLDWTMVRPPELTNGPYTGKYRVRKGHLPAFGFKISRANVADYMIKAVEQHLSSRTIVGLSN
jgi:putative NADH-flavin reductase